MDYERIREQLAQSDAVERTTAPDPAPPGLEGLPTESVPRRRRAERRRREPTPTTNRHAIRQLALLALFELDVTDHPYEDVVERVIADPYLSAGADTIERPDEAELDLPPEAVADHRVLEQGVRDLVFGVIRFAEAIDATIVAAAPAYPIDRIGTIDRNVLRLGVYEMEYVRAEPNADVVNDAVELGKRFGGDSTSGFVNGVLRTISDQILAAEKRTP